MSLGVRVGLALLVPMLLLVALVAYQTSVIDRLVSENREIGMVHRRLEAEAVELREALMRLGEFGEKMVATGDSTYADAAGHARADVKNGIEELRALSPEGPERQATEIIADTWRQTVSEAEHFGSADIKRLDALVGDLIETTRETSARLVESGAEQAARARRVSRVVATLCVAVSALLALLLVRMVSQPIRRVARATRGVAEGDFTRRARPSGPPELAALARDFNAMADRLGEIDRLKEDLLTNVSHDLKAPLASMHETNALILDELPGPLTERQRGLLRHNQVSNRRLSKMVADILDLTRLQGNAMPFDFRRLDLVRLARTAARDLEPGADAAGVAIDLSPPDGEVWAEGDETLLLRALENLVSNALHYSRPGDHVGVDVERGTNGRVRVVVRDQGPGIPDEHKEQIFERFFRISTAAPAGGQGTGIGLAIVASITAAHEGTVRVEDEPGGGSRFVVELPGSEGA